MILLLQIRSKSMKNREVGQMINWTRQMPKSRTSLIQALSATINTKCLVIEFQAIQTATIKRDLSSLISRNLTPKKKIRLFPSTKTKHSCILSSNSKQLRLILSYNWISTIILICLMICSSIRDLLSKRKILIDDLLLIHVLLDKSHHRT